MVGEVNASLALMKCPCGHPRSFHCDSERLLFLGTEGFGFGMFYYRDKVTSAWWEPEQQERYSGKRHIPVYWRCTYCTPVGMMRPYVVHSIALLHRSCFHPAHNISISLVVYAAPHERLVPGLYRCRN